GVRGAPPGGGPERRGPVHHRLGAPRGGSGPAGEAQGPPLPLQARPAQRPRRRDPGSPGLGQENAAGVGRARPLSACPTAPVSSSSCSGLCSSVNSSRRLSASKATADAVTIVTLIAASRL